MPFIDSGSFVGAFADIGGEVNTIEIDALDFEKASVVLMELAGYVEHVNNPLRLAQRIAIEDMKERFETETAPDGQRWVELSPDYRERKQKEVGDKNILTRDTDLRDAATKASAWTIGADSLFFSTDGLPEYWRVHQEGSEDFGSVFHPSFVEETMSLPGGDNAQNIPPRPFIGLSSDAEDKILDVFDLWFHEGISAASKNYAVSSSGTLQTRLPSGRFGPKPIIG